MLRRKRIYFYYFMVVFTLYCLYQMGLTDYIFTKDLDTSFDYPLNIDIKPLIVQIKAGKEPSVKPINLYPYKFLNNVDICKKQYVHLLILVKSSMKNFKQRNGIRKSWGSNDNVSGYTVKVLFFLGINETPTSDLQNEINQEIKTHKDIVQIDFVDNYFNNTIKTMMSFRWAYLNCRKAEYYLFSDDDMYISVENLITYISNHLESVYNNPNIPYNNDLFSGYVFKSRPLRYKGSKWQITLSEYPWNKWPTYVTAGAYVVSSGALKKIYLGSLFVKHFRFDDIYLGIVAKKVGIEPLHCSEFYYYKLTFTLSRYKSVIASHGYGDPDELVRVWTEVKNIT